MGRLATIERASGRVELLRPISGVYRSGRFESLVLMQRIAGTASLRQPSGGVPSGRASGVGTAPRETRKRAKGAAYTPDTPAAERSECPIVRSRKHLRELRSRRALDP